MCSYLDEEPHRETATTPQVQFAAHRIPRAGHSLYARDYPGASSTFVLLHGFPDNLHIYDAVAPRLAAAGVRVIAFDFLAYGASDKPEDFAYSARAWEEDLTAVLDALHVRSPILVAHDASGPTAIHYALDHPGLVGGLALMNIYYGEAPSLRFPEFTRLHSRAPLGR